MSTTYSSSTHSSDSTATRAAAQGHILAAHAIDSTAKLDAKLSSEVSTLAQAALSSGYTLGSRESTESFAIRLCGHEEGKAVASLMERSFLRHEDPAHAMCQFSTDLQSLLSEQFKASYEGDELKAQKKATGVVAEVVTLLTRNGVVEAALAVARGRAAAYQTEASFTATVGKTGDDLAAFVNQKQDEIRHLHSERCLNRGIRYQEEMSHLVDQIRMRITDRTTHKSSLQAEVISKAILAESKGSPLVIAALRHPMASLWANYCLSHGELRDLAQLRAEFLAQVAPMLLEKHYEPADLLRKADHLFNYLSKGMDEVGVRSYIQSYLESAGVSASDVERCRLTKILETPLVATGEAISEADTKAHLRAEYELQLASMKKTIAAFNFDLSTRSKVLYSTSKEIPPATFIDMMFKERAHGLAFYGIAQFFQEGPRTESRTNELIRMGLKTYFGEGIKAVYNDQKATYDASSGLKKLVRSAEHGKDPEERLNTWLDKATEAFVLRLMDKENRIDRATIEAHRASYGDLSGIKSKALDPERKIALVSDLQIRANERFDRAMNHLCERVCSSVGRSRSRTLRADEILVDFKSTDFAELYQAYYSRFNIESADPFAFTLEVTLRLTKALGAQFPEKYFTAPEAREACRLLVIQLAGALTHLKEEELSIMRAGARCERGPWVLDEAINKYIEQIGAQRELARLEASASGAGSSSRSSIAASGSSVSLDSSDAAKAIPLDVTSAAGTGIEATDAPKRD